MNFVNETEKQAYYISKCKEIISNREKELGRKLKACVATFGCQMNFKDSEKLIGILNEIGYEETEDEHADLVLYNTCTVRENANLKIYGRLGYLSKLKKADLIYETRYKNYIYYECRKNMLLKKSKRVINL